MLELPTGKKYRTILADPPWPYRQALPSSKENDKVWGGLPYKPMTAEEIAALPVGTISEDESMLFLWTTNSHLHLAFHIVEVWGFEYKTMATWEKNRFGLGYWLRGQTEHLLLSVRGNPREGFVGPNGATGKAWSTIIRSPVTHHSKKPILVYHMAEDIAQPPRIELFARGRREGWDAWGNELTEHPVEGFFP